MLTRAESYYYISGLSKLCKSSSQKRKTKVIRINKKKHRNGINISTREDRSVRRLSDATIDRTRRMGRELGAFLVCDFFSRVHARARERERF